MNALEEIDERIAADRHAEALALHDALDEKDRRRKRALAQRTQILLGLGRPAEAAEALRAFEARGGDPRRALSLAARVHEAAGDGDAHRAALARLAALRPDEPKFQMRLAQAALRAGDADAALAAVAAAQAAGGDERRALSVKVKAQGMASDRDGQVATLQRLCEIEPDETAHAVHLVQALARSSDPAAAADRADGLLARAPDDPNAYTAAFDALSGAGRHDEAAEVVERAVRDCPEPPRFWKFVLMGLDLPPERIERLVRMLCDRWPDRYLTEFARGGDNVDPETALLMTAIDEPDRALGMADEMVEAASKPPRVRAMLHDMARAMPRRDALRREIVRDDATAELVVSAPGGSGRTVLAFCGGAQKLGVDVEVFDAFCAKRDASAVYCRDRSLGMFLSGLPSLGGTREATTEALRGTLDRLGTRELIVVTSSGGGLGGLACALPLAPARIAMMVPQTEVSVASFRAQGLPASILALIEQAEARYPPEDLDMRLRLAAADAVPEIRIAYGADSPFDAAQAERVSDLPQVRLVPVEGCAEHNVGNHLLARGMLDDLVFGTP